ncbi:YheV family putative zinc ribbon protein [Microbulbifer thermotolerans]|uniref:YheV family putative zinc ribbon protein n=1 Tax=Microbulbifer thermotolerans TaxID=252514 RepID=UPI002248DCBA|nr:YheV family putative zinc ribbon protein [Microbulbifer thermotolerans]MCX2830847.1 YheV family putative metal-binding protein [Microbulbifer thermotolerans]
MKQDEGEKPPKKRFIAGAVCPRCGQMDRIVNYRQNDKNYRECIACGFKDEIRLQSSPRELATRVHRPAGEEEIAVPVKIIQPSKKQT